MSEPTTTWRYCISRERVGDEDIFALRELYTDSESGALSWSANPVAAQGETWTECVDDLALMGRAMNAPVLDLTLDPPALVSPRAFRGGTA